jgi:hypothetical protein
MPRRPASPDPVAAGLVVALDSGCVHIPGTGPNAVSYFRKGERMRADDPRALAAPLFFLGDGLPDEAYAQEAARIRFRDA